MMRISGRSAGDAGIISAIERRRRTTKFLAKAERGTASKGYF
jgi:hypothetical protein